MTVIFFLVTGQSNSKDAVFDTVKVKKLRVVDDNGKVMAVIGSNELGGQMNIYNKENYPMISIGTVTGGGSLGIFNNDLEAVGSLFCTTYGDGMISLTDRKGDKIWLKTAVNGR